MTREDLKDYKYTQQWINDRQMYIEEYRTDIEKITTTLSDMPKGSNQVEDKMAEKIAKLLDMVDELAEKIVEKVEKQKEILEQLDKVEMPYKLILDKAYIQGKSLVTVASEMGYEYKYMCKMNGIALNKFDNTTKEV